MHCPSCGTRLTPQARFCASCGRPVEPTTAPQGTITGSTTSPSPPPPLPREELAAALAVRNELGERMEPEVIDAFLARVERTLMARVDARIDERLKDYPKARRDDGALPLAICSLIFGIPLTAIAAGTVGLVGLIVCWVGIAAVNVAYAARGRRR